MRQAKIVCAAVIAALYLIGELQLYLHPPTELDKHCLKSSLAQLQRCEWEQWAKQFNGVYDDGLALSFHR